jgi:hypothetical protein
MKNGVMWFSVVFAAAIENRGRTRIHIRADPRLNALKQVIALCANVAAAIFFLFSGKVIWSATIVMAIGALVGGGIGGLVADQVRCAVLLLCSAWQPPSHISFYNGCSPLPFWILEEKQMVEYFQPKM